MITAEERKARDREAKKIRYQYRKESGICVRCGVNEAERGKTMCYFCNYKASEKARKKWSEITEEEKKEHRISSSKSSKKQRKERLEKGKCTKCGRELQEGYAYKMCYDCRVVAKEYARQVRLRKGMIPRILFDGVQWCHLCGRNEPIKCKKLCQKCYDITCESLKKTRAKQNKDGFQKMNSLIFYKKENNNEAEREIDKE